MASNQEDFKRHIKFTCLKNAWSQVRTRQIDKFYKKHHHKLSVITASWQFT